jgi:hypothetical protein
MKDYSEKKISNSKTMGCHQWFVFRKNSSITITSLKKQKIILLFFSFCQTCELVNVIQLT